MIWPIPKLHAIVIFFARNAEERDRSKLEHQKLIAKCPGVQITFFVGSGRCTTI